MAKENKKTLVTKSTLIIRLIAGMYLLYLAYELFAGLDMGEGAPVGVSITAAVLFVICGLVLVIFNGRDFLQGNYEGGMKDMTKSREENKTRQEGDLEDTIEEKLVK